MSGNPTNTRTARLTLDEILETWLPARVEGLQDMLWVLSLSRKFGSDTPIQLHIKDGPAFQSNLSLVATPTILLGYLHARAILEFMGISARGGKLIKVKKRRDGDVAIEHYETPECKLNAISVEDVYTAIHMPPQVVEWAVVSIIEFANKFVAHVTSGEVLSMALDHQVEIALQGTLTLLQNHLFARLGRSDAIPIERGSGYACGLSRENKA